LGGVLQKKRNEREKSRIGDTQTGVTEREDYILQKSEKENGKLRPQKERKRWGGRENFLGGSEIKRSQSISAANVLNREGIRASFNHHLFSTNNVKGGWGRRLLLGKDSFTPGRRKVFRKSGQTTR